jgi:hypothetical protein
MKQRTEFMALHVIDYRSKPDAVVELRFVNRNHILQVWQENDDVIIELTDYERLRICNENIYKFMDRFI